RNGYDLTCAAELTRLPFGAGSFDYVVSLDVLGHVEFGEKDAVLAEAARVLRPGGLLWATTPHGRGISARLLRERWSVVSPPEHIQLFSMRGMRRLLERAGFRDVRLAAHGVNPYEIVHTLRSRGTTSCDRVETGYALNAFMSERPARRVLKGAINAALSTTRLGDSLKVYATTAPRGA
ncbi:MAG: methyltransferase domain-containing protein, partial [Acidobacteriota bacterium]|nr:methyltransferase domain-containing protein [Acidobacteriota bacterium]